MVYLLALVSACVTGAILALGFRMATGIEHAGILIAIAIIGGGLQAIFLMVWYMRHISQKVELAKRSDPLPIITTGDDERA